MIKQFKLRKKKYIDVKCSKENMNNIEDAHKYPDADTCIYCGCIIPEGRLLCPKCEKKI